jgi:peptidoglycan/xylan/chitin deacetylase (PgdA/CDA1 family)
MKEMQEDGISFGSHSLSHPRLSQIDSDKARFEIRKSKEILQSRLGREIDFFAYPYGDMNEAVEKMVKEAGYKAAVWAWGGINRKDTNIYQLRRIPVFDSDTNLQLKLKLAFARYKVTPGFLVKYYWSRILSRMRQAAGRELQAAPEVPQY